MRQLRAWTVRILGHFRKQRRDRELAEELDSHLQLHISDNLRAGMTPEQARREALLALGGLEQTKEEFRDRSVLPTLEHLLQDLRYAARMLRKSPGFSLVAILTLALGIGINAGIFSILNSAVLRPLPIAGSSQLVGVYQAFHGKYRRNVHGTSSFFSYPEYLDYRDHNQVLSGLAAYAPFVEASLGGDRPQRLVGTLSSCNYFDVLRAPVQLGRSFIEAECAQLSDGHVVVLSDGLWRSQFGADRGIVGKTVVINRTPFTVVGIAAAGFQGTEVVASDFWAPIASAVVLERNVELDLVHDANVSWLCLLGRVPEGTSLSRVRANLDVIASRIDQRYPGRTTMLTVTSASLASLPEVRNIVLGVGAVILIAVTLVLLIACANVANLLLARAASRRREVAVRLAVGASRGRLIQQLLTESMLLGVLGGAAGVLLAIWSSAALVRIVLAHLPPGMPTFNFTVGPDFRVLAYGGAMTLLTGVAFGLAPALQSTRHDLNTGLKSDGTTELERSRGGLWRTGLVTAQVAVCMLLLITAGLLVRGLYRAQTIDPNLNIKNIAVVSLDLSAGGYDQQRAAAFNQQLMSKLQALPGVDQVAEAHNVPLSDNHTRYEFIVPTDKSEFNPEVNVVSPDYFPLLGIPIVRGRNFTDAEIASDAPVMIVSQATARILWPGQDPLGKVLIEEKKVPREVVGVAADAQTSHLGVLDGAYVYLPAGPREQLRALFLIRSNAPFSGSNLSIRAALHELDSQLPVSVAPLEDNLEFWRAPSRIASALGGTLAGLALLLATMGVYGMVSYAVSRRVREIGIRMALGADGRGVMSLILRQALRPVLIGAVLGMAACAAVSTVLSAMLYGVSPHDPLAFVTVPLFLISIALIASYLPARRAMRVDPMVALRHE